MNDGIIEQLQARLRGKTAWIIGGKRIGQTVSQALAELGVNIFVSYRESETEARAAVAMAEKLGVKALALKTGDIRLSANLEEAVMRAWQHFGQIDFLVYMASVFKKSNSSVIPSNEWSINFDVHVKGAYDASLALANRWQKNNHPGKIIIFTDRTALPGAPDYEDFDAYIVTKAAAAAVVRRLAKKLARTSIRVNAIAPGPILRPPTISSEEWQKETRDQAPLRNIDDDEAVRQVANAVIYLLTQELSTGSTLVLDSGLNLH